jgi:hypothetical protein
MKRLFGLFNMGNAGQKQLNKEQSERLESLLRGLYNDFQWNVRAFMLQEKLDEYDRKNKEKEKEVCELLGRKYNEFSEYQVICISEGTKKAYKLKEFPKIISSVTKKEIQPSEIQKPVLKEPTDQEMLKNLSFLDLVHKENKKTGLLQVKLEHEEAVNNYCEKKNINIDYFNFACKIIEIDDKEGVGFFVPKKYVLKELTQQEMLSKLYELQQLAHKDSTKLESISEYEQAVRGYCNKCNIHYVSVEDFEGDYQITHPKNETDVYHIEDNDIIDIETFDPKRNLLK